MSIYSISLLKNYGLDFESFLLNGINSSNFTDHYSTVVQILESFQADSNQINLKDQSRMITFSNKLIDFCLDKLFQSSQSSSMPTKSKSSSSTNSGFNDEYLINYIGTCLNFCSIDQLAHLFQVFAYYLINLVFYREGGKSTEISYPKCLETFLRSPNSTLKSLERLNLETSNSSSSFFNQNFIINLNRLFLTIVKHKDLGESFKNSDSILKDLIGFILDYSMKTLYEIENEPAIKKFCISIIYQLANTDSMLADLVLDLAFKRILSTYNRYENQVINNESLIASIQALKASSFKFNTNLKLLTSLSDFYMRKDLFESNKKTLGNIMKEKAFWYIIQTGLYHNDSLSRKQALYLLKRSIDFFNVNQIKDDEFKCFESTTSGDKYQVPLMTTMKNAKLWDDFFLVIELLEETSIHIIKPSLPRVKNLLDAIRAKEFHFSWLLVLVRRAFSHESRVAVRWAVSTFFEANLEELVKESWSSNDRFYNNQRLIRQLNVFIIDVIIKLAQRSYLFYKADDAVFIDLCPKISILYSTFIRNYTESLPSVDQKTSFIEAFLKEVSETTWNSVCLYFTIKVIHDSNFNFIQHFDPKVLNVFQNILQCSLSTHDEFIRSATITTIFNTFINKTTLNSKSIDSSFLTNFPNFLNMFSTRECFKYRSNSWLSAIDWLKCALADNDKQLEMFKKSVEMDYFANFIDKSLDEFSLENSSSKFAKLILILNDLSDDVSVRVLKNVVDSMFDCLNTCNKYVYMNAEKIEKSLFVFNSMISLILEQNQNQHKQQQQMNPVERARKSFKTVESMFEATSFNLTDFMLRKFENADDKNLNTRKVNLYCQILKNLLNFSALVNSAKYSQNLIKIVTSNVSTLFGDIQKESYSFHRKRIIYLRLLSILIESIDKETLKQTLAFTRSSINSILFFRIPQKADLSSFMRDLPDELINDLIGNISVLNGQINRDLWIIYNYFVQLKLVAMENQKKDFEVYLLNKYYDDIELTSPYNLASFIQSLNNVFISIDNGCQEIRSKYEMILNSLFKATLEIGHDIRNFFDSYKNFLNLIFQSYYFSEKENFKQFGTLIIQLTNELIKRGVEKSRLIRPLTENLLNVVKKLDAELNVEFIEIFIDLLIFDDAYRKEKKYLSEIEIFIESFGDSFTPNTIYEPSYIEDTSTRVNLINYLLTADNLNENFFAQILEKLIEKNMRIVEKSTNNFINSLKYRERFRLWQTILVLIPKIGQRNYENLFKTIDSNLVFETQPSIRVLLEWSLIQIIFRSKEFDWNEYVKKFQMTTDKKIGYTCSLLNILAHSVQLAQSDSTKIELFKKLSQVLFSQILSNNFHVRTFAEAVFIKIYNHMSQPIEQSSNGLNEKSFIENAEVKSIFSFIKLIVEPTINCAERHSNILLKLFYFQFKPVEHFCINVIFYLLPYVCGVIEDELIDAELYIRILHKKKKHELTTKDFDIQLPISLNSADYKSIENCSKGLWRYTAFKDDSSTSSDIAVEDLQKKIIPWHSLIPKQQDLENLNIKKIDPKDSDGLVLIANLIDKNTNLGGICRTCEIFNVKELILDNLKQTEDKLFQHLSVTSENWMNIKEVPKKQLKHYLLEMKTRGYLLVGVEQTANSIKLNNFKFPKNTVLLLGNEKEGIPVEYIQILDSCVEIPQFGLIRSLNVHVSAAITIWEYTKQINNI